MNQVGKSGGQDNMECGCLLFAFGGSMGMNKLARAENQPRPFGLLMNIGSPLFHNMRFRMKGI